MDINNARGTPGYLAGIVIGAVGALVLIAICFKGKIHY